MTYHLKYEVNDRLVDWPQTFHILELAEVLVVTRFIRQRCIIETRDDGKTAFARLYAYGEQISSESCFATDIDPE
jgi:hypothetical protein